MYSVFSPTLAILKVSCLECWNKVKQLTYVAMTTDPGAVPPNACPLDGELEGGRYHRPGSTHGLPKSMVCQRCNAFKPPRAHHCSICNRCVVKVCRFLRWLWFFIYVKCRWIIIALGWTTALALEIRNCSWTSCFIFSLFPSIRSFWTSGGWLTAYTRKNTLYSSVELSNCFFRTESKWKWSVTTASDSLCARYSCSVKSFSSASSRAVCFWSKWRDVTREPIRSIASRLRLVLVAVEMTRLVVEFWWIEIEKTTVLIVFLSAESGIQRSIWLWWQDTVSSAPRFAISRNHPLIPGFSLIGCGHLP